MKIDEPKTPYHTYMEPVDESEPPDSSGKVKRGSVEMGGGPVDPSDLSNQLLKKQVTPLKSSVLVEETTDEAESEQAKQFKARRAAHYGKEFVKKEDLPSDPEDD